MAMETFIYNLYNYKLTQEVYIMLLSRLAKILLPAAVFGLVACSDDNIQQPDTSQNLDGSVEQKLEARIDGVQYNEGGIPLEKATPDKWNDSDIKPPNNYKGKTGGKVPVGGPIPEVSGQGKKGDVKWKYKITNPSQGLDGNIAAGVLPKTTTGSARKIAFDWDTTLPINGKVPTSGTFTIEYIACNNLNQTLCQSTKRTVELTTGNSDPIINHYVIQTTVNNSKLVLKAYGNDPDGDKTTWSIGKNDFGTYDLLPGGNFFTKGFMTTGKTGIVEFILTDNYVNYASVDQFLQSVRSQSKWHTYPTRGALYIQDKLEFKGMIANLGIRLDYSHAGGDWYAIDNPYDMAFSAEQSAGIDTLLAKEPTDHIFDFSPRLGIAFPITLNSKLFFNYGHFRQMPTPENLYLLRRYTDNNAVTRLANPNNPLPKTIQYELGYEHNLFNIFLLRLAGYYKDSSLQSRLIKYVSRNNKVSYNVTKPYSYQDTRGFELTLRKNRGSWIRGFVNYTYEVTTSGNFGFYNYYENPAEQRRYERETRSHYQEKPIQQYIVSHSSYTFYLSTRCSMCY